MANLITTLMVAHFLASAGCVAIRNLKGATWALVFQSLFLSAIFSSFAFFAGNQSLHWWSFVCLLTKVVGIPTMLFHFLRRLPVEEPKPIVSFALSLGVLAVFLIGLYKFIHANISFIAPTEEATYEPVRSALTLSFLIFALGVFVLMTRRDVVKIVIGIVLMENGAHLTLVTLAPALKSTVVLGIVTNVIVAAFVMLYLSYEVFKIFGTTDATKISELKR